MKKILWLGVALMVVLNVSVGLAVFADETNCIGDTSGKTNCNVDGDTSAALPPLSADETTISYGNITETGRSYTKYLTLKNNTSTAMTVRLEAVALDENNELSAADWIVFAGGKRKYDIVAGGSVQVGVRIMVPTDAKGGTYYAKVNVNNGKENEKLEVVVRADVANEDYKFGGEISSQSVGFFNLGKKITAEAKIKNTGTAGFSAHYLVQYKNSFGLSDWGQIAEETRDIVPGSEESFSADNEKAEIGYGIFIVEQRVSYVDAEGKQKEAVLSHAVVNLPWWAFAIVGGAILLIIIIVIVVKVRRKKAEDFKKEEKRAKKKSIAVEVKEDE